MKMHVDDVDKYLQREFLLPMVLAACCQVPSVADDQWILHGCPLYV
jgi:hypothetical protein